eukprot:2396241-Amphidinium_carterae.1
MGSAIATERLYVISAINKNWYRSSKNSNSFGDSSSKACSGLMSCSVHVGSDKTKANQSRATSAATIPNMPTEVTFTLVVPEVRMLIVLQSSVVQLLQVKPDTVLPRRLTAVSCDVHEVEMPHPPSAASTRQPEVTSKE